MIKIEDLKNLKEDGGFTLKKGEPITYKTGYQVATEGKLAHSAEEALKMIEEYEGNCGVWLYEGTYYIDKSHRESTKKRAIEVGRRHEQISIFKWSNQSLVYC